MWLYRTGCDAKKAIALYEYQPSRHACHAKEFLRDFRGFLHVDGYEGYHDLPQGITVAGCWAHARRRFEKALKVVPKSAKANSPPAEALRRIGQLYKLEEEFQGLPQDDNFKSRFEARQERSKPLIGAFFDWCKVQNALPKTSAVTVAIRAEMASLVVFR